MPGRATDLIEIPDSLWQRAAMTEALRDRDIGRVFRLVSQYAGISQTRLAIACGTTQPKISGIMRGTARVEALEVFERIAGGLGMPAAARIALGLAPDYPEFLAGVPPSRPDGRAPGTGRPGLAPDPRQPGPFGLALEGSADAAAMQAFRSADLQVGGGHVYASVLRYLQTDVSPRLFGAGDDGDSSAVVTSAAALTEMAGWMAHDAGEDAAARRHFARSLSLVQLGGDWQLGAHVLGSMSHLASHLNQPDEAISLAGQGQAILRQGAPTPDLEARLLAMEARGRAARREAAACAKLLTRAERLLSESPAGQRSPWLSRFDGGSLAGEAAQCMSLLGNWAQARRQAEEIVRLRDPGRIRSRAFGQLTLAAALIAQGHPDEACSVAQEAMDATRSLGSFRVIEQLRGLRAALRPHAASPPAAGFLERLDESLRERRWLSQASPSPASGYQERP